ncbi:MAG TPA: cation transporter [Anaerolineaceae bacterium]
MTTRIVFKIAGMECPNCAMTLESLEDKLPGVQRAEASYHKAQMVVEFDEDRVSEAQIRAAIQKLGYEAQ